MKSCFSEFSTEILYFQAEDKDSGRLGTIEYNLVPDSKGMSEYFMIENQTGSIRTKRSLDGIPEEDLPIRLTVEAKDNPSGESKSAYVQVVVSEESE